MKNEKDENLQQSKLSLSNEIPPSSTLLYDFIDYHYRKHHGDQKRLEVDTSDPEICKGAAHKYAWIGKYDHVNKGHDLWRCSVCGHKISLPRHILNTKSTSHLRGIISHND